MPPVKAIVDQGLDVIGMVRETNKAITSIGRLVSLKQLYRLAQPVQSNKGILCSIHTVMANGTSIKVAFMQNRNKKSE